MVDALELLKLIEGISNISVSSGNRRISARVDPSKLKDVIKTLKEKGFTHLSAITGLEVEDGIELLYHLSKGETILTLRTRIPSNNTVIQSIVDIIPGAALYEQEIYDLLGVKFEGQKEQKRLILPDDWPEDLYPLRRGKYMENR